MTIVEAIVGWASLVAGAVVALRNAWRFFRCGRDEAHALIGSALLLIGAVFVPWTAARWAAAALALVDTGGVQWLVYDAVSSRGSRTAAQR